MTSAAGNVTYLSHGENKLNHHPLNPKMFADFSCKIADFHNRLLDIPKDDKIDIISLQSRNEIYH